MCQRMWIEVHDVCAHTNTSTCIWLLIIEPSAPSYIHLEHLRVYGHYSVKGVQ